MPGTNNFRWRVLLIACGLFWPGIGLARLATMADLPIAFDFYHAAIQVDRRGHYTSTEEMRYRILNDNGRLEDSRQNIDYDDNSTRVTVLRAYTITDGKRYVVSKSDIQRQDIAGSPLGFDRSRRLVVNFPDVKIGSQLYLKYRSDVYHSTIPNFFSMNAVLGHTTNLDYRVTLRSRLKLYTYLHDPDHFLKLTSHRAGGWNVVEIRSVRPMMNVVVDERYSFVRPDRLPQWLVSTKQRWGDFAKTMIERYERIIQAPIPAAFAKIREDAAKRKTTIGKLNQITSELASRIRYFGDWQRRRGAILPRSLQEIAKTGYGDCKDFAVSVTAIARRLGLQANVAWIYRGGYMVPDTTYQLPSTGGFDHAISRIQSGRHVYWIDGTNETSWAQGIPADISNREAFVLNLPTPFLAKTPKRRARDSITHINLDYQPVAGPRSRSHQQTQFEVHGHIKLLGESANQFYQQLFSLSQKMLDYAWVDALANGIELLKWRAGPKLEPKRIPQNETLKVHFRLGAMGFGTTAGIGFPAPEDPIVRRLLVELKGRYGDLKLFQPGIQNRRTVLNHVNFVGSRSLNCNIKSPWVNLSRTMKERNGSIILDDHDRIKTDYLPIEDLRSPLFASFQGKVRRCFENVE